MKHFQFHVKYIHHGKNSYRKVRPSLNYLIQKIYKLKIIKFLAKDFTIYIIINYMIKSVIEISGFNAITNSLK